MKEGRSVGVMARRCSDSEEKMYDITGARCEVRGTYVMWSVVYVEDAAKEVGCWIGGEGWDDAGCG